MRIALLTTLIFMSLSIFAQRINQIPDTLRKPIPENKDKTTRIVQEGDQGNITAEDVVKNHLVKIALNNPAFIIDDANIKIAELNRKRAGASWLGSVTLGSNVNEFVINNSPAASFYPKYNFGLTVPFDIFSRLKNEKRVADENIIIARANKQVHEAAIKAETLTRYENYKEKADLVTLQNIIIANNLADYHLAQKNLEDGSITVEALNNVYQNYMKEKNKLISYKKDFNIAIIQLEDILGMTLEKAAPGLLIK